MTKLTSNAVAVTTTALMADEALGALYDLRWMVVLAVFLVIADFWLGTNVSHIKGVDIRFSRAWRRTVSKMVEYIMYLIGGALLGLAIFEPMGVATHTASAAACLLLGCSFELQSIVSHIVYIRTGKEANFNVWTFGIGLIKSKNREVGEAIERAGRAERTEEE